MGNLRNFSLFLGLSVLVSSMIIPLNQTATACGIHGTNAGNDINDWLVTPLDVRTGLWELRLEGFETLAYTSGEMCSCALQIPETWGVQSASLVFAGTNDLVPGFPEFLPDLDLSIVLNEALPSPDSSWVALKNTIGSEDTRFPGGDEADFVLIVKAVGETDLDIRQGLDGKQFSAGKVIDGSYDPNHFQVLTLFDGILVDIDVNPNSENDVVNLNGNGVIPIAILSTETFDATIIDPSSIVVEPGEAKIAHKKGHIEDVNIDDRDDLVIHVGKADITLKKDGLIIIHGKTLDGINLKGSSDVVLKGKKILEN